MAELILHTGTNLGNKLANLAKANFLISSKIGPIKKRSSIYITEPWGVKEQSDFLNQALLVETSLEPRAVLKEVHYIEKCLGRIRGIKWQSRLIDIDLMFYDQEVIEEEGLNLPHKHLHERNFVLIPLNEIIPTFNHPVFNKSISNLLLACKDEGLVKKSTNFA